MLRKPFVLVFFRFGSWRGIMGNCYENKPTENPSRPTAATKEAGKLGKNKKIVCILAHVMK